MRKRDLGILLLAALAIFFSLQHEGDFTFREAWVHFSEEYPIKYEAERLPPPLVTDLNGDGKSEILVATHDAKIQVLEPHGRRVDEGFMEARVLAEVSLLPDKVRITSGRRAVAMSAGVVDRSYTHGDDVSRKKKVLVVVTEGWGVMCFDSNLKKLWENNLQEDFPHGAHHREISISISNYTLKHGDAGLIIVGGRMEMKNHNNMDILEEAMMSERDTHLPRRSANEKENAGASSTVDLRHFAFYAFAGKTGQLRWSRKNENVDAQPSDANILIPQHNYKLDVNALNSRRPGEFECREFRESILSAMPHSWERREDTRLELSHFRRHKRKITKKMAGRSTTTTVHKPTENNPLGKDPSNKIAKAIGKAADYASSSRPKKRSLYIPTITNHTQVWWVPNVVIAHQKEGIEAVHLASGRTVCKLHLTEGGLHADINGDGVLDHVQVVGKHGAGMSVVSGTPHLLRPCWAVATSGVPIREQLFNVSICHYYGHLNLFPNGDFSRFAHRGGGYDTSTLEVAAPILVRREDGHRHRKGSHGDVVFLTSRGEVTSYSPGLHGHDAIWRFQLSTGATWSNLPSPLGLTETLIVPTLKPFYLRKAPNSPQVIIAAGDQEAVIISPNGAVLTEIELPAQPTHELILEDFNGDGLTDVILVSGSGVYGFVQARQPGALFFSTLVGCLIVVMAVLFVSQQINASKKPRGGGMI